MKDISFSDYGDITKDYTKKELISIYKQIIEDISSENFSSSENIIAIPLPFRIGDRVKDKTTGGIYIVTGFNLNEQGLSFNCYEEGTEREQTEDWELICDNYLKL